MLIFRRSNFIIAASGIVTLYKQLYSTPVERRLLCSLLSQRLPVSPSIAYDCVGKRNI
jgi:hypothetical protein